jgi:hypothetical protein
LNIRFYFRFHAGGPPLPAEEILSRHLVQGSIRVTAVKCLFLCEEHTRCVGFNVRASFNNENCQLTNVTKSKNKTISNEGEWKLYRDLDSVCKIHVFFIVRYLSVFEIYRFMYIQVIQKEIPPTILCIVSLYVTSYICFKLYIFSIYVPSFIYVSSFLYWMDACMDGYLT